MFKMIYKDKQKRKCIYIKAVLFFYNIRLVVLTKMLFYLNSKM